MKNRLKEYKPDSKLCKYLDSFWFFRNDTGSEINFPVVPDGCSDLIIYLNNGKKLYGINNTFVSGVMENAELVPIPINMELLGIRFKPGVLSYILNTDMSNLTNKMTDLSEINNRSLKHFKIDVNNDDRLIISLIESRLKEIISEDIITDNFLETIEKIYDDPAISINELSVFSNLSIKQLERVFKFRIGLTPKKFARISRFHKAHMQISKKGLEDLISIALSSGYFDQAHFNREYKKLVGCNPSNNTMSILYNT